MPPRTRASQFVGCSRWQRGPVAGSAPESVPFLLEAGDRAVQMRCPGNSVSRWATEKGELGAGLIVLP